jgi:hypothetical protein
MPWQALGAGGLALVALAVAGTAWWEDVPPLTAADAVTATQDAFDGAGVEADVATDPVRTTYASRTRDPVDVWAVRATVRAELVQVQLTRDGAHPVAIDDRSLDGSTYVLSDLEYETLAAHVDDPARTRRVQRNVTITIAAVLVVALALGHAATTTRKEPR